MVVLICSSRETQNSGKTTYTRAAVKEIDRRQPIRTLEADFELIFK